MQTFYDEEEGDKVRADSVKLFCPKHLQEHAAATPLAYEDNKVHTMPFEDIATKAKKGIKEKLIKILSEKKMFSGVLRGTPSTKRPAAPKPAEKTDFSDQEDISDILPGIQTNEIYGTSDTFTGNATDLQEDDPVAHYNRFKQEKYERDAEASRQAARRSRGLPATPARRPGRPHAEDEAGMVETTTYSNRLLKQVTGVDVSSSTDPETGEITYKGTVRPEEVRKTLPDGGEYIEAGHAPERARGKRAPSLRTIRTPDPFVPSHYAPADPDQASLRRRLDPTEFDTDAAKAAVFMLNLVGNERGDKDTLNTQDFNAMSVNIESARRAGLVTNPEADTATAELGSSQELSQNRGSTKVYPLAVKVHHSGHAMAWHAGEPRMVHIDPAMDHTGKALTHKGKQLYYWIPTKTIALNANGTPYTKEEMNSAQLYRDAQTEQERISELDISDPKQAENFVSSLRTVVNASRKRGARAASAERKAAFDVGGAGQ